MLRISAATRLLILWYWMCRRRKVKLCEELTTQSEVLGAAAGASPRNLLEMQTLHRPTESESAFEQGPQVILKH